MAGAGGERREKSMTDDGLIGSLAWATGVK